MDGWLPSFFPTMTVPDPSIASIASFAMSLLLAYRTSSSYRRWEEARSLFGALINRSRDLHRQVRSILSPSILTVHFAVFDFLFGKRQTHRSMDCSFVLLFDVDPPNGRTSTLRFAIRRSFAHGALHTRRSIVTHSQRFSISTGSSASKALVLPSNVIPHFNSMRNRRLCSDSTANKLNHAGRHHRRL